MKMKMISLVILVFFANSYAQTDLEKLVATEKSFARVAAEKNTKAAFVEFAADDAIVFNPNAVNAIEVWQSQPDTVTSLAWSLEFADISTNGALGYTTGAWEYRANGKSDAPSGFGHFVTVWQKQMDGNFKYVLNVGIDHSQMPLADKWMTPTQANKGLSPVKAADAARQFFETAKKNGLEKAYKTFASDDVRLYRQGKTSFLGKKMAIDEVKKKTFSIRVSPRSIFVSTENLAYLSNSYTATDKSGKVVETGNFLQIWKLREGAWQIVLDLFKPN